MSLFMRVGIQFTFKTFLDSIETTSTPSRKIPRESTGLTLSCIELAKKGDIKLSHDSHIDTVSTLLSFLASAPLELALCKGNLDLLDRVVGLDILSSQVIKLGLDEHKSDAPQLLNIVRSTKTIIANLLPKTLLCSSDFGAPCLANMTSRLSKTCVDFGFDEGVLFASTNAISEFFSICLDNCERNAGMLGDFFTQMGSFVCDDADTDKTSNPLLIRSVIRRMNVLDRHHSLSKKTTSSNISPYELCMRFILDVQKQLQSTMLQQLLKADKSGGNALLLESEILSFIGNYMVSIPVKNLMTNEQVEGTKENVRAVFQIVASVQGSQCSLEFIHASNYFLSAMAAAPSYILQCVLPSVLLESVLAALAQSFSRGQESQLLDAALCSLIRGSGLEETKTVIAHVLSQPDGGNRVDSAFITKIFHLLITCANSPEQHKFISGKCKTFLLIAIGLLRDTSDRSQSILNAKLFSKTMATLISKKELLLLSGREIAMICCGMNPLFNCYGVKENDDADENASIFSSCCLVVASLIAHYPKQLYGCPSALFSFLLTLLSNILQTSAKKGLSHKALEYAKVCELLIPHKDIFKKHVVSLVLCYIRALSEGMNPTTKSKLMPSIYALLDMCSDFETRQINAMIDVPSKTLFAPVFQSYRKYYQYHGQA